MQNNSLKNANKATIYSLNKLKLSTWVTQILNKHSFHGHNFFHFCIPRLSLQFYMCHPEHFGWVYAVYPMNALL